MSVIRIERLDDSALDDYRNVSDAELLRRRNLFVAEGRLVVRQLLSSGHHVVSLLLNEPSLASLEADVGPALADIPVYVCPTAELAEIVGFNLHRGCMALAARPPDRDPLDVTRAAALLLVLENVTDADNVGSAIRNAAAFGVDGVLMSACCDPLYRKSVRTSIGHVLEMPYARVSNVDAEMAALKGHGFTLVALTPHEDATPLPDFAASPASRGKIAVLAGNEHAGLSARACALADLRVRIPIKSGVDSLNVATAIAIALDRLTNRSRSNVIP
jgi:tRNA G18 (ribose-2'-O)-methylase SpoU